MKKKSLDAKTKLVLNIITFIVLAVVFYKFVYVKVDAYFDLDVQNQSKLAQISELKTKGINFTDLQTYLTQTPSQNQLFKVTFENTDNATFTNNFSNSGTGNYVDFLRSLQVKYSGEKSEEMQEKLAALEEVLPKYTENDGQGGYGDFKFVNQLENILYVFNLENTSSIGVGSITIVPDTRNSGNTNAANSSDPAAATPAPAKLSTEKVIYETTLNLSLKGKKKNFFAFLEYIGALGQMEITSAGDINILKTEKNTLQNIEAYQLLTISNISISESIDSKKPRFPANRPFIDYIKLTQGEEEVTFSIDLNFYFTGASSFEISETISTFTTKHKNLQTKIQNELTKLESSPGAKDFARINRLKLVLAQINSYVSSNASSVNTGNISETDINAFFLAKRYLNELEKIEKSLNFEDSNSGNVNNSGNTGDLQPDPALYLEELP